MRKPVGCEGLGGTVRSARDARRGDPTVAAPRSPLATKSITKKKPSPAEPVVVKTNEKPPETPSPREPA